MEGHFIVAVTTVAGWDQDLQQIRQLLEELQASYTLREWLALPMAICHFMAILDNGEVYNYTGTGQTGLRNCVNCNW